MPDVAASDVAAEVSTTIKAPRGTVWDSLVNLDTMSEYFLGARVATDWVVGHPITWSGEWQGKAYEDKGEILAFEPETRLCFSHWSSIGGAPDEPATRHVVDITLEDAGDDTEVTLVQTNLEGGITASDREHREDYELDLVLDPRSTQGAGRTLTYGGAPASRSGR